MPLPLFVYGTLLMPGRRKEIIGREPGGRPARLEGYRRLVIARRRYPGLLAAAGETVQGRLLEHLSPQELRRLDRYEGGEYRRLALRVAVPGGYRLAWVYVPRKGVPLGPDGWEPPESDR